MYMYIYIHIYTRIRTHTPANPAAAATVHSQLPPLAVGSAAPESLKMSKETYDYMI